MCKLNFIRLKSTGTSNFRYPYTYKPHFNALFSVHRGIQLEIKDFPAFLADKK